ncbi:MAG: hypothetical protein ACXV5Q_08925 [Frankiaceae bacterium]
MIIRRYWALGCALTKRGGAYRAAKLALPLVASPTGWVRAGADSPDHYVRLDGNGSPCTAIHRLRSRRSHPLGWPR